MYDVAAGLAHAGHQVTVLAINTPKHYQPDHVLAHLPGVSLQTVAVDTRLSPWKALRNLALGQVPYNVERFISPAFEAALRELLRNGQFDVVQLEGTFVAWYVNIVRAEAPKTPVILRAHNLEHGIWQMLASRETNPVKRWYLSHLATGLRTFEQDYLPRFDAIAAITEPDQRRLRELNCQEPVVFIPAGVDLQRFQRNPGIHAQPRTLFMISSLNWLPNQEGLDWFLSQVWPRISDRLPDLELHLAGKDMPPRYQQLRLPRVVVHGFVDSAAEFMQQYELMLVPLLSGGGMRVKIIEGMALGKCILSTGVGSEGIYCQNNKDIILCDDPEEWAERIERYYHGELCHDKLGEEAAATIKRLYDNRRIIEKFEELYRSLSLQPA